MTTTITLAPPEVDPEPAVPRRRRRWLVLLLAALLLIGGIVVRSRSSDDATAADIRDGTTVVDADGLAARYGIEVSLIAVTAAGGLIEFRYQVVDPDKADPVRHDPALLPAIVVEDTGATLVLQSPPQHHSTETRLGGTYFVLFPNARNAVHRGSKLTVVIGDVRLEHVEAQE